MMIEQLMTQLQESGIKTETDGTELTLDAPKGALTPALVQQLKANKQAIVDYLLTTPVVLPMTDAQRDVWLAIELDGAVNQAYNLANGLRLTGELDVAGLKTAVSQLIQRHEALRTVPDRDGIHQRILPSVDFELAQVDLSALAPAAQQADLNQLKLAEVTTPFALYDEPLFRAKLVKLNSNEHLLLLTAHHIIADGWSMGILTDNLAKLYTAVITNSPPQLNKLMPLRHYVEQQNSADQSAAYQEAERYWLDQFADKVPVLDLPNDYQRPAKKTFNALQVDRLLDDGLMAKIKTAASAQNSTLFAYLMTAYQTMLHRFSGNADVVVGIPVAGQLQFGDVDLVGDCVNFLPIRLTFDESATFADMLGTARSKITQGFSHQNYPVGTLIKNLPIKRDASRMPLISVAFNQYPTISAEGFAGLTAVSEILPHVTELYDIFFNVVETARGFEIHCLANSDLFTKQTIERQIDAFVALLAGSVADVNTAVSHLPILSHDAYQTVIHDWNQTEMAYDKNATLATLFAEQAERTPEKTAVIFNDQQLTYAKLNQQASQLAAHLHTLNVQPNQFIGLCVDRSPAMLVGLLAIHKVGAAYLPMDPTYPNERLAYMLEDAAAQILITEQPLLADLPTFDGTIVLINEHNQQTTQNYQLPITNYQLPITNYQLPIVNSELAYVIHTSGSTGKPKGVVISHQNVVNFLETMRQAPGIGEDDVLLAVTTLSFDIAVLELFLPLVNGATLVLADQEMVADGRLLANTINQHNVTIMQATPATWQMMLATGWEPTPTLKMLSGGEALPHKLAQTLVADGNELWNMYGPTETTIWSSVWRVERGTAVLIGKPIGNTQMYILDSHHNPVPIGVSGELWIGGDGVAQGYLNRPDMTAERFIANPFIDGERIYHTGDLARWRDDGTIECLGRLDFQVKVRGFRIELGEIEAQLEQHAYVRRAVVNAVEFGADDKRLVAYLLLDAGLVEVETAVLRQHLQAKLPGYMIPAHFVTLDHFPLTPNGKVDRKALPLPIGDARGSKPYSPPTSETEQTLASNWISLLKIEQIGTEDDFFELGGHSLLATQMMTELRDRFEVDLPLATFFDAPTIGELAKAVEAAQWATQSHAPTFESSDELEEFEI